MKIVDQPDLDATRISIVGSGNTPEDEKTPNSPGSNGNNLRPSGAPSWRAALAVPLWLVPLWLVVTSFMPKTAFTTLSGLFTITLVVVCAYSDIRWGKIRNSATYTAILWALVMGIVQSNIGIDEESIGPPSWLSTVLPRPAEALGAVGITDALAGAVLVFAAMAVVYSIKGSGAGDLKLATALGALMGPTQGIEVILWSYVIAGVGILVWLVLSMGPLVLIQGGIRKIGSTMFPAMVASPDLEFSNVMKRKLRMGPFFAAGTLSVMAGFNIFLVNHLFGGYR